MREAEVAVFVARRERAKVLATHRAPAPGGYSHTVAGGIEAAHSLLVDAPGAWEPALDREHDGSLWCVPEDACTTFHGQETADTLRLLPAAP